MNSDGTHLHVVFPGKPFTIDNYLFNTDGSIKYLVNNTSVIIKSTLLKSTNGANSCSPPVNGNWTVNNNCTLTTSGTVKQDLIIEDGYNLTLDGDMILDMNLKDYKILIKPNANLVIKNGAKII